eukprot:COSAG01_NODE_2947_length_6810_cov_12.567342_9_plen_109_part_00
MADDWVHRTFKPVHAPTPLLDHTNTAAGAPLRAVSGPGVKPLAPPACAAAAAAAAEQQAAASESAGRAIAALRAVEARLENASERRCVETQRAAGVMAVRAHQQVRSG